MKARRDLEALLFRPVIPCRFSPNGLLCGQEALLLPIYTGLSTACPSSLVGLSENLGYTPCFRSPGPARAKKANCSLAAALWMVSCIRWKCSTIVLRRCSVRLYLGQKARQHMISSNLLNWPRCHKERRTTGKSGGPAPRPRRNKFRGFSLLVLSQPRRNNNGAQL